MSGVNQFPFRLFSVDGVCDHWLKVNLTLRSFNLQYSLSPIDFKQGYLVITQTNRFANPQIELMVFHELYRKIGSCNDRKNLSKQQNQNAELTETRRPGSNE